MSKAIYPPYEHPAYTVIETAEHINRIRPGDLLQREQSRGVYCPPGMRYFGPCIVVQYIELRKQDEAGKTYIVFHSRAATDDRIGERIFLKEGDRENPMFQLYRFVPGDPPKVWLHDVRCDKGFKTDRYTCRSPECREATCTRQPYMGASQWEAALSEFLIAHPCDEIELDNGFQRRSETPTLDMAHTLFCLKFFLNYTDGGARDYLSKHPGTCREILDYWSANATDTSGAHDTTILRRHRERIEEIVDRAELVGERNRAIWEATGTLEGMVGATRPGR